jgi:hypothetical protein
MKICVKCDNYRLALPGNIQNCRIVGGRQTQLSDVFRHNSHGRKMLNR